MPNILQVCRRGTELRQVVASRRPLEIGSGADCELRVDDSGLAPRQWLVQERGGTVLAFDVSTPGRLPAARVLPLAQPLALGSEHSLVRLYQRNAAPPPSRPEAGHEAPLAEAVSDAAVTHVAVGLGKEARRVPLRDRPLTIGSAPDNDLVLFDAAASPYHCRVEPAGRGVVLRDLGSAHGIWANGVRVRIAELGAGARWRLGRTDLQLLPLCTAAFGGSDAAVEAQVQRYAALRWPVWIHGESGVGKDRVAQALHAQGARAAGPWVAINAAALPESLLESELFGHEKGAFTGAAGLHRGVFEQAQHGTLFIDEIGELSLSMQSRLLRVLDHWEVRRVGGSQAVPVDVRLVCATHRDLKAMVAAGSFRADLFYRLSQLVIEVPALRERGDIADIAAAVLSDLQSELGMRRLSSGALARLLAYPWPGNIRELRNVLCSAAVESPAAMLEAGDIEAALRRCGSPSPAVDPCASLQQLVRAHGGNLSAAARALGVARSTLRGRLLASPSCAL